ncbi:colicin E3/pyocin S6 family cytotoxin [Nitratidesulfovibrio vulgaris]|uniref:colicin E3/pyocin S6 family cytotoxin n=1 Tax=Nitratidesulfovibrio vulgaris TaxID=881 RepID=UPI003B9681E9
MPPLGFWFIRQRERVLTRLPRPPQSFLDGLERFKVIEGRQTWVDRKRQRFYQWDAFHGEVEVYNARGRHIGVMDTTGNFIKDAERGRKIDVS